MIPSILTAYTDRLSYEPGSPLRLHVSSPTPSSADVSLVRLEAALDSPGKEGKTSEVAWDGPRQIDTAGQDGLYGSFMLAGFVGASTARDVFSFGAFVRLSAAAGEGFQSILCLGVDGDSVTLGLMGGAPTVRRTTEGMTAEVRLDSPLDPYAWHLVVGSVSAPEGLGIRVVTAETPAGDVSAVLGEPVTPVRLESAVVAGAFPAVLERANTVVRGKAADNFTGKIGWPFIIEGLASATDVKDLAAVGDPRRSLIASRIIGAWDFALKDRVDLNQVTAVGQVSTGLLANLPTRGVTGRTWRGDVQHFWVDPTQYSAVHFHDTDVVDAGWTPAFEARLPENLPSGVYGLKIATQDESDIVPFCVCPSRRGPKHRALVILPTFTYLAYANEAIFVGLDGNLTGGAPAEPNEADLAHVGNRTFGLSQYDLHGDGSGVAFTSAARPIVNMRHDYKMWLSESGRGFSAEMYLIEWMTSIGVEFDVVTDLELHAWGAEFLRDYSVVVSGAHPEYYSGRMLDALLHYRDDGGRIMYLGGNGFYWVTGVVSEDPLVLEIRRDYGAINTWKSEPGESALVSTYEQGGIWRHRGRPPQRLVGIGTVAQGWGGSVPFYRTEASRSDEFDWIFAGVDEEPLGAYGRVMGGAAGDEIDRVAFDLGTPPDAVVLAASRNHSNFYQRVPEEVGMILHGQHGGQVDPEVHSDIVYFRTPSGGEVFSAGSIAFSGALLVNDGDNGVSRMTQNVLRRFMAD